MHHSDKNHIQIKFKIQHKQTLLIQICFRHVVVFLVETRPKKVGPLLHVCYVHIEINIETTSLTVHSCRSHSGRHHVTGSSHGIEFGHQHGYSVTKTIHLISFVT